MKEGASNCVERHLTIATLPFYGHIVKWGISVVFIANALRRAPYAGIRTYVLAWVPGLPRSVRVLIMRRRPVFECLPPTHN